MDFLRWCNGAYNHIHLEEGITCIEFKWINKSSSSFVPEVQLCFCYLLHSDKGERVGQYLQYVMHNYDFYHCWYLVSRTEAHIWSSVNSVCISSVWNIHLYLPCSITNYCQPTIVSSITEYYRACYFHLYAHIFTWRSIVSFKVMNVLLLKVPLVVPETMMWLSQ